MLDEEGGEEDLEAERRNIAVHEHRPISAQVRQVVHEVPGQ